MDDRREKRPPCVGCKHLDELHGFPGTGYCRLGRSRITLLSERCDAYRFDADALQRSMDAAEELQEEERRRANSLRYRTKGEST